MSRKSYDYIIIGAGLNSLILAQELEKSGAKICIVEKSADFGGKLAYAKAKFGAQAFPFASMPNSPLSQLAIQFLKNVSGLDLQATEVEHDILTYEQAKLQSFFGFGNKAPAFLDELSYYLVPQRLELNYSYREIAENIRSQLNADFKFNSELTKFRTSENLVQGIEINQSEEMSAGNFILGSSPFYINELLEENYIGTRNLQKLAKSKIWASVCLDLVHQNNIANAGQLHLLSGSGETAVPLIGFFSNNADGNSQTSHWLSFIPSEFGEDEEMGGDLIREMKRQIKRAYPQSFEKKPFEKISLFSATHGQIPLKLDGSQRLAGLNNLYFASGHLHSAQNIVGSLLQTQLVAAALGLSQYIQDSSQLQAHFEDSEETQITE